VHTPWIDVKKNHWPISKTKKVLITEFGGEDKLAIVDDDIPEPAAGEVQIAVEYMRRGTYPFQRTAPLTPGYSVVGKVRTNGQRSSRFQVGERIACLSKYEGRRN
jgi:NADPH:quinone reductase-like Zn-dependent oxidoreductase